MRANDFLEEAGADPLQTITEEPKNMSVSELKRELEEDNMKVPAHIAEKDELIAMVSELSLQVVSCHAKDLCNWIIIRLQGCDMEM